MAGPTKKTWPSEIDNIHDPPVLSTDLPTLVAGQARHIPLGQVLEQVGERRRGIDSLRRPWKEDVAAMVLEGYDAEANSLGSSTDAGSTARGSHPEETAMIAESFHCRASNSESTDAVTEVFSGISDFLVSMTPRRAEKEEVASDRATAPNNAATPEAGERGHDVADLSGTPSNVDVELPKSFAELTEAHYLHGGEEGEGTPEQTAMMASPIQSFRVYDGIEFGGVEVAAAEDRSFSVRDAHQVDAPSPLARSRDARTTPDDSALCPPRDTEGPSTLYSMKSLPHPPSPGREGGNWSPLSLPRECAVPTTGQPPGEVRSAEVQRPPPNPVRASLSILLPRALIRPAACHDSVPPPASRNARPGGQASRGLRPCVFEISSSSTPLPPNPCAQAALLWATHTMCAHPSLACAGYSWGVMHQAQGRIS